MSTVLVKYRRDTDNQVLLTERAALVGALRYTQWEHALRVLLTPMTFTNGPFNNYYLFIINCVAYWGQCFTTSIKKTVTRCIDLAFEMFLFLNCDRVIMLLQCRLGHTVASVSSTSVSLSMSDISESYFYICSAAPEPSQKNSQTSDSTSCGCRRVAGSVRLPSCVCHRVVDIVWLPSCGCHRVVAIVWLPSCGCHRVVAIVWLPSFGCHHVVVFVWLPICSCQCMTGSMLNMFSINAHSNNRVYDAHATSTNDHDVAISRGIDGTWSRYDRQPAAHAHDGHYNIPTPRVGIHYRNFESHKLVPGTCARRHIRRRPAVRLHFKSISTNDADIFERRNVSLVNKKDAVC